MCTGEGAGGAGRPSPHLRRLPARRDRVASGYEEVNEGLRWVDLDFRLVIERGSASVKMDSTIRNLKGQRGSGAYRTQLLYEDHSLPFFCDAVRVAFSLALQDDIFEDATLYNLASYDELSNSNAPRSSHGGSGGELEEVELIIKAGKLDQIVCRRIVGGKGWVADDVAGWRVGALERAVADAAPRAGMPSFTSYTVRLCVATALNRPDVTEGTARHIIGHQPGTRMYERHYVSKRMATDLQGIMAHGEEQLSEVAPRGLERKTFAPRAAEKRAGPKRWTTSWRSTSASRTLPTPSSSKRMGPRRPVMAAREPTNLAQIGHLPTSVLLHRGDAVKVTQQAHPLLCTREWPVAAS